MSSQDIGGRSDGRKSGAPCRGLVCHAGRVEIVLPPHWLQCRRLPVSGTVRVSGSLSTLTSAWRPLCLRWRYEAHLLRRVRGDRRSAALKHCH